MHTYQSVSPPVAVATSQTAYVYIYVYICIYVYVCTSMYSMCIDDTGSGIVQFIITLEIMHIMILQKFSMYFSECHFYLSRWVTLQLHTQYIAVRYGNIYFYNMFQFRSDLPLLLILVCKDWCKHSYYILIFSIPFPWYFHTLRSLQGAKTGGVLQQG